MKHKDKTKNQNISELEKLQERIKELEILETEHKLIADMLLESKEEFKAIFDGASNGIVVLDMTGKLIRVNKYMLDVGGYSEEELVGKRFSLLKMFPPKSIAKMISVFSKIKKGKDVPPYEMELFVKSREKKTAEVRNSLLRKKGRVVGVIAILTDITERKKAEDKIKASLKEKDVMLREIHHRVKNNMQIISSLLRLQSRNVKDETALDMFKVSQNRIRSMAFIHEALYQSEDLAMIDFSIYIRKLITHLFSVYSTETKLPNLRLNVKDVYLDINRAIPCGLIINELVSNSLKHAFPDSKKGEITVEMRSDKKGKYTLIVKDTGIGMPKELNIHKTETLGMQLVNDLAEQIDGTIELNRIGGTTFLIMF